MTREEIENIPKLVDFMLDKCVLADSRTKVCERLKEVCNLAIKTVEQEPCDDANANQHNSNALNDGGQHKNALEGDAISRQAALEKIHWLGLDNDTAIKCDLAIRALPPVNPQEPKTGHWIKTISENGITSAARCSECGFEDNRYMLFRYCPNCGTKMVEPQESEDKDGGL